VSRKHLLAQHGCIFQAPIPLGPEPDPGVGAIGRPTARVDCRILRQRDDVQHGRPTVAGQDFGKLAFKVRFKVVAPQEAKPSITDVLVRCLRTICPLGKLAGPLYPDPSAQQSTRLIRRPPGATERFFRPGLAIPQRVAPQQSPHPFHQTQPSYSVDWAVPSHNFSKPAKRASRVRVGLFRLCSVLGDRLRSDRILDFARLIMNYNTLVHCRF
jgi:hypothetical protein